MVNANTPSVHPYKTARISDENMDKLQTQNSRSCISKRCCIISTLIVLSLVIITFIIVGVLIGTKPTFISTEVRLGSTAGVNLNGQDFKFQLISTTKLFANNYIPYTIPNARIKMFLQSDIDKFAYETGNGEINGAHVPARSEFNLEIPIDVEVKGVSLSNINSLINVVTQDGPFTVLSKNCIQTKGKLPVSYRVYADILMFSNIMVAEGSMNIDCPEFKA